MPEDLVQDTFLRFLKGLAGFREQASLETFLFVILRRRLAEVHRGKRVSVCELPQSDESSHGSEILPADDPTASWYVRRDEQRDAARTALTTALRSLIQKMQQADDFRDLQIVELMFYAHWPNKQIAQELGIDANSIALLKHRWIKQLHERVAPMLEHRLGNADIPWDMPDAVDSLLTEIWEDQRPSCPKRSTIGGFLLGTLDDAWPAYIDFHIKRLGCSFCNASFEDMQQQTQQDPGALRSHPAIDGGIFPQSLIRDLKTASRAQRFFAATGLVRA